MCGHVGIFGSQIASTHVDAFEDLLFMDALRGDHATGVARVDVNGNCTVIKKPVPSWEFLAEQDVISMLRIGATSMALIGHNRYATQGALTSENAHPFTHGHITMAHNGTLRSRSGLKGSLTDFEVDSNHIAYTLSKDDAATFLPKVNGAYALVWHDTTSNTITFVRNDERPMHIAKVKDKDVYIYASEIGMLYAAATRKKRNIIFEYVDELPVHTIRTYQLTKSFKEAVTKLDDVVYTKEASSYDWDSYSRGDTWYSKATGKPTLRLVGGGSAALPLSVYKLSVGDSILFTPMEFVPYNAKLADSMADDKVYGAIVGYSDEYPYFDVVISGITRKVGKEYIEASHSYSKTLQGNAAGTGSTQRYITGELVSADKDYPYVIIRSDTVSIVEVPNTIEFTNEDDTPFSLDDEDECKVTVNNGGSPRTFSLRDYNTITKYGCSMCSSSLFIADAPYIRLYHGDSPVCQSCHNEVVKVEEIANDVRRH